MQPDDVACQAAVAGEHLEFGAAATTFAVMPDDVFVSDQDHANAGVAEQRSRGLDRDFRTDPIGIADRQRDRLEAVRHSGSASRVSKRELSQTTIRSRSLGVVPFSL